MPRPLWSGLAWLPTFKMSLFTSFSLFNCQIFRLHTHLYTRTLSSDEKIITGFWHVYYEHALTNLQLFALGSSSSCVTNGSKIDSSKRPLNVCILKEASGFARRSWTLMAKPAWREQKQMMILTGWRKTSHLTSHVYHEGPVSVPYSIPVHNPTILTDRTFILESSTQTHWPHWHLASIPHLTHTHNKN